MPFRSSKIKEAFNRIDLFEIYNIFKEKTKEGMSPEEITIWVANSFSEDEEGLVGAFYVGMIVGNIFAGGVEVKTHGRGEENEGTTTEVTTEDKGSSGEDRGKRGRKRKGGKEE